MAEVALSAIHAITTNKAKQLYIKALGGEPLSPIKDIGFASGTGYIRPDFSIIQPNPAITELPGEFLRIPITNANKTYPSFNSIQFHITFNVSESSVSGQNLALFGLYDTSGNLIAFDSVSRLLLLSDNLIVSTNWLMKCP